MLALVQQVMSQPSAPSPQAPSPTVAAPARGAHTEPDDAPRSYSHVPILTKENYPKWQLTVKAFLTPGDHVRVIRRTKDASGVLHDPVEPTDAADLERWMRAERHAMGVIMGTASDLHYEILTRYEHGRVWPLWKAIETQHVSHDASLRHEAWMQLFGIRQRPGESYLDLYHRVDDAHSRIDRITPTSQSVQEHSDEIALFTLLSAIRPDDPLHRQLVSQKGITLDDAYSAFLRIDRDVAVASEIESASAAFIPRCHRCDLPGHYARDCPHFDAISRLVGQRVGAGTGAGSSNSGASGNNGSNGNNGHNSHNGNNGSGRRRGRGRGANAANANATTTNDNTAPTSTTPTQETAGVATTFLSHELRAADDWLCDSGASSSMSSNRSAFSSLKSDRRPIRLADGKVIYSEGLGSIRFVSNCGYEIPIDNVLYVPFLTVSLFASNKFAREHRDTHSEITEYPKRRWFNRRTGATEFTATIRSNDLAYLDWRPIQTTESTCVSIEELHARLNHIPHSAIRHLIQSGAINGVPDRATGTTTDDFCEDCVNGKLTRAPHSKPAARAERPLLRVFSDVHGPVPVQSRQGHYYWVTFIDDYSRFPAVYFIAKKSDVYDAFRKYKAWAENVTGRRIGILRDDKGGEYMAGIFDKFLAEAGIRQEHSICDTPQQVGVAERMNRSIAEGVTTLLSQSGLTRTWWEDAATHWLHGKIRLPSSTTAPLTPFELFYGRKPDLSSMRPFGCLAYVHLQKDQRPALLPHAAQCVLIGYPVDYKGWRFWDPQGRKEIVSDSAVFRESVFPLRRPGLSGVDKSVDPAPPIVAAPPTAPEPPAILFPAIPADPAPPPTLPPAPMTQPDAAPIPIPNPAINPVGNANPMPQLVVRVQTPPPVPPHLPLQDLPERPRTPPTIRQLTSHFEHHPSLEPPLPPKCASRARIPGALAEANSAGAHGVAVPLVDAVECALNTSISIEPKTLADALSRPDADKWIAAALAEIEAHLQNGTWELAQLPPGRRAIGSRWVFKIKRLPDGSIDKYKGRIVAQGFSQVQGIHYNEIFASTARMAAMRAVIAIAAAEDLELESVDISTAFLNGDIDAEVYMKVPEGLEVEGDPRPGEDPKRWVVRLLKGLYGIKQGPRIWALKLHSVLTSIGFERIDCDYSVYVYRRDDVRVMMPIHVDDLLLASNSKAAIQRVKSDLATHFKLHDQGPATSILGIKIERNRAARTISLSQPGYVESILEQFGMADCNPSLTPMDENEKLSARMSPDTPERQSEMRTIPYRELIGKLLYLAIATRPDISYVVGVLCRFVENPGLPHWYAAKRVLRYLRGTTHMKLIYSRSSTPDLFTTYSDADLSGNPDNSRSTGGFAVCIGEGAIQWGSRLQPHVSLSSTESEYTTASKVGCEIMWMRYLFEELGYDVSRPSPLLVDNKSAIQVTKHPEHQSTMKHVHHAYHWIRDQVDQKQIAVSHVPGDENPADIFTKPLGRLKFTKFRAMLGLHP